jgi:hypothetical protein
MNLCITHATFELKVQLHNHYGLLQPMAELKLLLVQHPTKHLMLADLHVELLEQQLQQDP